MMTSLGGGYRDLWRSVFHFPPNTQADGIPARKKRWALFKVEEILTVSRFTLFSNDVKRSSPSLHYSYDHSVFPVFPQR